MLVIGFFTVTLVVYAAKNGVEGFAAGEMRPTLTVFLALTPVIVAKVQSASPVCYADEFEMQTQCFDGVCEGRIAFTPGGSDSRNW